MEADVLDDSASQAPEVRLGQRERLVAEKRLAGESVDSIAAELGIKPSSVRSTMHRVYKKFDVDGLVALREVAPHLLPAVETAAIASDNEEHDGECDAMGALIVKVAFLLCVPASIL